MATHLNSGRAARWALGAALALALGLTPLAAQAQTYTDLHDFKPNATGPTGFELGRLAQGRDGNFYAESLRGGIASHMGTIFRVTPTGTVTVIHSLNQGDGIQPFGGLTLGGDGNFYGNATRGGTASLGTVFKVTPSGNLTVLHNFTNGGTPTSAFVVGANESLYGITSGGPETIHQITLSGIFSTIHTLTSNEGFDGGQLSLGRDGDLYGGNDAGGANDDGTAFKIAPAGTLKVLHNFDGTDGLYAYSGMVQAANGTFYGATYEGGSSNAGVAYSLTSSGTFTLLHSLNSTTDGQYPIGQLLLASDGNLYGVTYGGGSAGCGTIFRVTPTGAYSVVYNFDCIHGGNSQEQVIQGTNGLIYGLVSSGGAFGSGAFYNLNLNLPAFAGLVSPAGKQGAALGILGQGFSSSSAVTFGGVPATSVSLGESTYLSAIVPAGALTGPVIVTTGTTTLTSIQAFQVKPVFTRFAPTSGPVGTPVTITGTGLTQTTAVSFNGTPATFAVNSDTQITATVPTGATSGKISVTTNGGSALSTTTFTVN